MTTAPDLPARTLVSGCYRIMFQGCTSLSYIKCLAENPNNGSFTNNWVTSVQSSGTFEKSSVAKDNEGSNPTKWPRSNSGIPTGWTVEDYVEP